MKGKIFHTTEYLAGRIHLFAMTARWEPCAREEGAKALSQRRVSERNEVKIRSRAISWDMRVQELCRNDKDADRGEEIRTSSRMICFGQQSVQISKEIAAVSITVFTAYGDRLIKCKGGLIFKKM